MNSEKQKAQTDLTNKPVKKVKKEVKKEVSIL